MARKSRQEHAQADAFDVVVAVVHRELFLDDEILGIAAEGGAQGLIALDHRQRVDVRAPEAASEAHRQIAAVLVGQLEQVGPMFPALRCRDRAGFVESPELLGIVETEEVRVVAEELTVDRRFQIGAVGIVGEVAEAAAGRLDHRPDTVGRCCLDPRACRLDPVRHLVPVALVVGGAFVADRERDQQYRIGAQVCRNQVDDLLRIGGVPGVGMDHEHRLIGREAAPECWIGTGARRCRGRLRRGWRHGAGGTHGDRRRLR